MIATSTSTDSLDAIEDALNMESPHASVGRTGGLLAPASRHTIICTVSVLRMEALRSECHLFFTHTQLDPQAALRTLFVHITPDHCELYKL